jgi:fatty acid/phospholipid biosynthesis enzyme
MENQLLFDKLAYVDRLIKSGIDEGQARALSDALGEALKESVATKNDIATLRVDLERLEHRLTVRVGAMFVGFYGLVLATLAAFKFF